MASRGLRCVALAAAFGSVAASPCEATFAHCETSLDAMMTCLVRVLSKSD